MTDPTRDARPRDEPPGGRPPGSEPAPPPDTTDADNPWPGLEAFREADAPFFRGREREVEELHRRVARSRVTALYGDSGTGKTSLVHAGLVPRLLDGSSLPVSVRLDWADDAPSAVEQVLDSVEREARRRGAEVPPREGSSTLWEYFHRRDAHLWSARNRLLRPVLIFDQFEEVFTRSEDWAAREAFLSDLTDLVEGRTPETVRRRVDENPPEALDFDFGRHDYHLLLVLREDHLPDLDELRDRHGLDVRSRLRLRPMDGRAALEVVAQAEHLISADLAERVVRFVANADPETPLERMAVAPSILSLLCRELNERRRARGEERITPGLLELSRDDILADFYERSFQGLPAGVRDFVEEELLTVKGARDSVALENALADPRLDRRSLDALVSRRLIRIDRQGRRRRVELTHDTLAPVVLAAPERRRRAAREEAVVRRAVRKGALWTAAVLLPLAALVLVWQLNSQARRLTETATVGLERIESSAGPVPTPEELSGLDAVRIQSDSVRAWLRDGGFGWVVWGRDELDQEAVEAWLAGFERVVAGRARASLRIYLQGAERQDPGLAYPELFRVLEAYLLLTVDPAERCRRPGALRRGDQRFATAVLDGWPAARSLDPPASELLAAQLQHFHDRVAWGCLHVDAPGPDVAAVARARNLLGSFPMEEIVYQGILDRVNEEHPPLAFSGVGSGRHLLLGDARVPHAFTRAGRISQEEASDLALRRSPEELADPWVLGDGLIERLLEDDAVYAAAVRWGWADTAAARYPQEYIRQWTDVLSSARVPPFTGIPDAAAKLRRLSARPSPLLDALQVVSRQTDLPELPRVQEAFRSIHRTFPPDAEGATESEMTEAEASFSSSRAAYLEALARLAQAMEALADPAAREEGAVAEVLQASAAAEQAIRGFAAGWSASPVEEPVLRAAEALVYDPVRKATALLRALPAAELNQAGRAFCARYSGLLSGFPFQPDLDRTVRAEDVGRALRPGGGLLWEFHQEDLGELMVRERGRWVPREEAGLMPTPAFAEFFSRAAAVSETLFEPGDGLPGIAFQVRFDLPPRYSYVELSVDGSEVEGFSPVDASSRVVRWSSASAEGAWIRVERGGVQETVAQGRPGPWGLFDLIRQAEVRPLAADRIRVSWPVSGTPTPLVAELTLRGDAGVLDPGFLRWAADCVPEVVR